MDGWGASEGVGGAEEEGQGGGNWRLDGEESGVVGWHF